MRLLNFQDIDDRIILEVELERRTQVCPVCGSLTDKIHDYRRQRVKDIPLHRKSLVWMYRKRRYVCECCNKRFYESNYLLPKWHRITNRLVLHSISMLETKQSRKDVAKAMYVSESSVARWLKLVEYGRPDKLPQVLSIDEFKGNTEYGKFQCILTAPTQKRVLDILPTIREEDISRYLETFKNRKDVRFFVSDMRRDYISMAKRLFPNATIVIDRFHVARYCTWALENVRKRVQKKLLPEQRKYFKRSRFLLLARMRTLSAENKAAVERMLLFDRDLREAYLLKEVFYQFMDSASSAEAKVKLREFRLHAYVAELPEFETCLTMLQNWEPYILNAFDCTYTNGFTEGCNNTVKVIKRIAYGYRNFDNFRRRILLTLNAKAPPAA